MEVSNIDEISRAIGELMGLYRSMDDKLDGIIDDRKTDVVESRESRHKLTNALQQNVGEIGGVKNELRTLKMDLEREIAALKADNAQLKPFVAKAEQWEQRGKGALAAAGMIGGTIATMTMTLMAYFKKEITAFFSGG
jgi:chromosome segregation ATPase